MNRILPGLCLIALLFPAGNALADGKDKPPPRIGTLDCDILPHTGINLLIHSTRNVECTFAPVSGGPIEIYKGETGIGFGIDVAFDRSSSLSYAVFAKQFIPGKHQLTGKYEGLGGNATFGVQAGQTAPIQNRKGTILMQPVEGKNKGAGVAAGYTYLYLQPDGK
ncbi:MAG: hypothetical protein COW19_01180 [Zetaproteobacteria bacterium CG12_big_fil_rev_8_21_14_0_65_55_1124]|nr:MAG: hypothetical protein AUJ58_08770 [Zetaproteobacteria bacterium CG1_02_55_237]PIS20483.1 MAG: hypothetical protein COT53_00225 [Zetaproteobacteria bacterium CG08_land_8_20_14_0_20_55_17]PIW43762.1 MAG: hypothetical protein COW19_01180 [Zetaproteobacteria bacterium CG12_big_fil_rev_8_21_14_0_65_55_1124]PIY53297.1 MAG: hypothetical protein COZ01_04380 [Zetaproteobacteria bacterium CG_4_10_14_0_8_um_filter_55_43]PIZ40130.1 MAG: hypothetical protein COY36_00595 [Zetaproteobacteria bacterium 